MSRSRARARAVFFAGVLIAVGAVGALACSTADPAADGLLDDAALQEADPVLAVKAGVRACAELAAVVEAEGGPTAPAAADAEQRLRAAARRSVVLLGRPEFDRWPDLRNRLRVDLLYVAAPPEAGDRAAAIARAAAVVARF